MKLIPKLIAAAAALAATTAFAGPPVAVTVKNLGTAAINYTIVNSNESSTYANAAPKPTSSIPVGLTNSFYVQSLISPSTNYASLRYRTKTGKECQFYTSFVYAYQSGGYYAPTWNKTATGYGGAICTATITSTSYYDYSWAVTFTMK